MLRPRREEEPILTPPPCLDISQGRAGSSTCLCWSELWFWPEADRGVFIGKSRRGYRFRRDHLRTQVIGCGLSAPGSSQLGRSQPHPGGRPCCAPMSSCPESGWDPGSSWGLPAPEHLPRGSQRRQWGVEAESPAGPPPIHGSAGSLPVSGERQKSTDPDCLRVSRFI